MKYFNPVFSSVGLLYIGSLFFNVKTCAADDFLKHAHKFVSIKDCGDGGIGDYRWLSNSEFLSFQDADDTELLFRFDKRAGKSAPLKKATKIFGETEGFHDTKVAPDGKHLLWLTDKGMLTVTPEGEGAAYHSVEEYPNASDTFWMDNRRWLRLIFGSTTERYEFPKYVHAEIHSLDSIKAIESWDVPAADPINEFPKNNAGDGRVRAAAMTADGRFLATYWTLNGSPRFQPILETGLGRKSALRAKRYFARLPDYAIVEDAVFSPKGDSIAWSLLIHVPHNLNVHESRSREFWASRFDGKEMHRISPRLKLPQLRDYAMSTYDAQKIDPTALRWLPDGKQISFVYKDAIWALSAAANPPAKKTKH